MKVAVPVRKRGTDAEIPGEFGRVPLFAIIEGESVTFIENPGASSGGGAGSKAAETVISTGAERVILRKPPGPHASRILQRAGISVEVSAFRTLSEVIEALKSSSHRV